MAVVSEVGKMRQLDEMQRAVDAAMAEHARLAREKRQRENLLFGWRRLRLEAYDEHNRRFLMPLILLRERRALNTWLGWWGARSAQLRVARRAGPDVLHHARAGARAQSRSHEPSTRHLHAERRIGHERR